MSVGRGAVPACPAGDSGFSHLTCGAQLFKTESLARRKLSGRVVGGRGGRDSEILQIQNIPLNLIEIIHLDIHFMGEICQIFYPVVFITIHTHRTNCNYHT